MPIQQPTQSFQNLRNYTEKWTWTDARTGIRTTGYIVPKEAKDAQRVPFHIRFVTKGGELEEGNVVCLSVDRRRHERLVKFVASDEIRRVYDYLIIEVDGTRFVTH